MEDNQEFELVAGKNFKTKYLFTGGERFLYVPVNKVNGCQRYKCFENGCPGGLSVRQSDNQITRFKKPHHVHGTHESKKVELSAIKKVKDNCHDVKELFANQEISTRAIFDKELVR